MATESIAAKSEHQDMIDLLTAVLDDLTAIRTSLNATLTKLDADTGVADTNYSALEAVAALNLTA